MNFNKIYIVNVIIMDRNKFSIIIAIKFKSKCCQCYLIFRTYQLLKAPFVYDSLIVTNTKNNWPTETEQLLKDYF